MMKLKLFIILIGIITHSFAQNIIDNHSFEDASAWGIVKTVDDYCGWNVDQVGECAPQDGNCYKGLRFYSVDQPNSQNWQEYVYQYIEGEMMADTVYKVSLWYSLADMCTRTTDDFGIEFVEDPYLGIYPMPGALPISVDPDIKLKEGDWILNSGDWKQLSGYYKADGTETWVTIGCFKVDNTLDTMGITSNHYYQQGDVYIYLDNVVVEPCIDYPAIDLPDEIIICEPGQVVLDAQYPGATHQWSTGAITESIIVDAQYTDVISVEVTKNGCSYTDSTKIIVFTQANPIEDRILCDDSSFPINITVYKRPEEQLIWDDQSTKPSRLIFDSGIYFATKSLGNCIWTDTFEIIDINSNYNIYPNPGKYPINLFEFPDSKILSITAMNGDLISNEQITHVEQLQIELAKLAPATYLLEIEIDGCRKTVKYVKVDN